MKSSTSAKPSAHITLPQTSKLRALEELVAYGWKRTLHTLIEIFLEGKISCIVIKSYSKMFSPTILLVQVAHVHIYHHVLCEQQSSACQFARLLLAVCLCSRPLRQRSVHQLSIK